MLLVSDDFWLISMFLTLKLITKIKTKRLFLLCSFRDLPKRLKVTKVCHISFMQVDFFDVFDPIKRYYQCKNFFVFCEKSFKYQNIKNCKTLLISFSSKHHQYPLKTHHKSPSKTPVLQLRPLTFDEKSQQTLHGSFFRTSKIQNEIFYCSPSR